MINNSVNDFKAFIEKEGYECPVCQEGYDIEPGQPNRQPTLLSCSDHNMCIECFKKIAERKVFDSCPLCRKSVSFTKDPVPNRQIIQAIELVKKMWVQFAPKSENPLASPVAPQAPKPIAVEIDQQIPEHFECRSLTEGFLHRKVIAQEIRCISLGIAQTMKWESLDIRKEFLDDLNTSTQEWVLFTNFSNQESLGAAHLKPITNTQWESHWTGVKQNNVDLYLEFYKRLLIFVERKKNNQAMDWRNVCLINYFNYDTEEQWFTPLIDLLQAHRIRYEIQYIHRQFANNVELHQVKLITYPCPKPGHTQVPLVLDNQKGLETNTSFEEYLKTEQDQWLNQLELGKLFRLVANSESEATKIKEAFLKSPQDFFIYTVEGKAKGFMQFERRDGNLNVISCKLTSDSFKYADHFIKRFIDWATTRPIYSKAINAKKVKFPRFLHSVLQSAIMKNLEKIEL